MSNKLLVKLARGTAASLAVSCLAPQRQPAIGAVSVVGFAPAAQDSFFTRTLGGGSTSKPITVAVRNSPTAWSKALDREFRSLALEEAKGSITRDGTARLKQLDGWRENLVNPRSADEILHQLQRDSILEKMSKTFEEYVQFKQGANRKRFATV